MEPVRFTVTLRHGTVLTPLHSTHSSRISVPSRTQPASSQSLENRRKTSEESAVLKISFHNREPYEDGNKPP